MNERTDIPSDLDTAIREFIAAGRKYREFLKRNYGDHQSYAWRMVGVVYAQNGNGEMAIYSEGQGCTETIKKMVRTIPGSY